MIDTSSVYKLELELTKLIDEQQEVSKLRAKAIKKVEYLEMKLDILSAEIVTELCKKNKIKSASGKSEIRRVDLYLDPFYTKTRKLLINANENKNILDGRYFTLSNKCKILIELYKNAKGQMYDATVKEKADTTTVSSKMNRMNEALEYDNIKEE